MFSHYIRHMVWIGKVLYMATIKSIIMKEIIRTIGVMALGVLLVLAIFAVYVLTIIAIL